MTSISRADFARPDAAASLTAGLRNARDIASRLLGAAFVRSAERAALRDLRDRPAWMLRDIGLIHGEIAAAVAGRAR